MDNPEIIAAISCTHFPYHHPDTMPFLRKINDVFKPTLWVHLGDENDGAAWKYHEVDPDMDSAGTELTKLRYYIQELADFVPRMFVMDSNHGNLVYRKAKTAGLSREQVRSPKEYLKSPEGWVWMPRLELEIDTGHNSNTKKFLFQHGSTQALKISRARSISVVQGHLHTEFYIHSWGESHNLRYAVQVGCLIDDASLAYAYNKTNVLPPILGACIIINGNPMLVPMRLGLDGRWIGVL